MTQSETAHIAPGHIALTGIFAAAGDFSSRNWEDFKPGVQASWVYRNGDAGPASAFLKYQPDTAIPWHWHPAWAATPSSQ